MAFRKMLEPIKNLQVDFAHHGEHCLAELKKKPHAYSYIFMDVEMPIMNGYEATKRIKKLI